MYCFGHFCIICINNTEDLIHLNVNVVLSEENVSLLQILMKIDPELLNIDEIVPKYICVSCQKDLITTYKFHKKCRKSIDNLNNYMNKLNHLRRPPNATTSKNTKTKSYTFGYNAITSRHMLFKIKKLTKNNYKTRKTKFKTLSSKRSNSSGSNYSISAKSCSDKSTVILEKPENFHLDNTINKLAKYLNITDLNKLDHNILEPENLEPEPLETDLNTTDLIDLDQKFYEVFNVTDDYFVKEENALDLGSCDLSDSCSDIYVKDEMKIERSSLEPGGNSKNNNYIDLTAKSRSYDQFIDLTTSPLRGSNNVGESEINFGFKLTGSNHFCDEIYQSNDLNISFEIKRELIDLNDSVGNLEPDDLELHSSNFLNQESGVSGSECNLDLADPKNLDLEIVEHPVMYDPEEMQEIKIEMQEMLDSLTSKNCKHKLDLLCSKFYKHDNNRNTRKDVNDPKDIQEPNDPNVQQREPNDPNVNVREGNDPNVNQREVNDLNVKQSVANDPNVKQKVPETISSTRTICDINLNSTYLNDPNLGSELVPDDPKTNEQITPTIKDPEYSPGALEPNDPKLPIEQKAKVLFTTNISNKNTKSESNLNLDEELNIFFEMEPNDPKNKISDFDETGQEIDSAKNIQDGIILELKDPNVQRPESKEPNDPNQENSEESTAIVINKIKTGLNKSPGNFDPNELNKEPNDLNQKENLDEPSDIVLNIDIPQTPEKVHQKELNNRKLMDQNDPKFIDQNDPKLIGQNDPELENLGPEISKNCNEDIQHNYSISGFKDLGTNDPKTPNINDPKTLDINDPKTHNISDQKSPNIQENKSNEQNLSPRNIDIIPKLIDLTTSPSTLIDNSSSIPYICRYCTFTYETGFQLKRHIFDEHHNKFIECPQCGMTFSNRFKLRRHADSCYMNINDPIDFRNSYQSFEKYRPLNITQFRSDYFKPRAILRRDNFRGARGPINCEMCNKVFFSSFNLNKHYYLDHNR